MNSLAHIVFIKYPQTGKVKTRLGASVGDMRAAEFYKLMVEQVLRSCYAPNIDTLLFIQPYERLDEFREWLGDEYTFYPQDGTDLGQKMFKALKAAFENGYEKCVLTGTDIPDLNIDIICQADEMLNQHDAVIGPAEDGGYYLIGFNKNTLTDVCFNKMTWSTDKVFEDTIKTFKEINYKISKLKTLSDLDDINDVRRMKNSLKDIIGKTGISL
ncbi:Protein of unknown function DUF2064 [Denitrovibrio acetiphilus DSM 12809]|uniref:Glycosyltransferase n=1 Tax=Denitrovibrio acetiphilus (strain DSM 12809 / NBRC 114555 / N2460) TaxID=522772 RepID=D4H820_DENA2|nr:TIGR04282 family arsenosugar biosynthesis glycosyltransferase [Denitrovibrio acetiphilus]ADD68169.1 Protein of unknown function DUF2064 [Denitrovibrio acetiphilus DSM 12809]